jgi:predicted molibdopterin-dependent oxidoreductase YjgC
MNKINLTINGKNITAEVGMTLLQAAETAGIEIPHLCYMPGLEATGACRICVVEVEGQRNLVASCAFPAADNQVVKTQSPRVVKARKAVMELLLSDHPFDCMTCEKSGGCKLEKYAYQLGISSSRFTGEKHSYQLDESNPFFFRDYNKCILCGRCVRACGDIQFVYAIDFAHRGFDCKIAAPYDRSLKESTCIFCGQCIASCPTGSLVEKSRHRAGREWELEKTDTVCSYCGVGCNLELSVRDNRIVRAAAAGNGSVAQNRLCVKGKFGWDYVHSKERLTTPLIRQGEKGEGKFRPATWEEALDLISEKLSQLKAKYGPGSLACLSSAKCTNEENYLLQKFTRVVLGTNNIDHCARL